MRLRLPSDRIADSLALSDLARTPGSQSGRRAGPFERLAKLVRATLRASATQAGLFVALFAAIGWLVYAGAASMGYNWQWSRVPQYVARWRGGHLQWGMLSLGLVQTLVISAHVAVLAAAIGTTVAVLRLSASFSGRFLARAYLEIVRNTPLLVQIYIFYFVIARIFPLDRFWAGVLALSCFEGAFVSEILRAGIVSIPAGQWEVCSTLGLSRMRTYRSVILPQAITAMLPPLVSAGISLIKDSSIVSVIGLLELTTAGRNAISDSFMSFEIWLTVAAIYLVVTLTLSTGVNILESRLRRRL
jgi:polar amino acid transport system permease protein